MQSVQFYRQPHRFVASALVNTCVMHACFGALLMGLAGCLRTGTDTGSFAKASADGPWTKISDIQNAVQPTNSFEGYNVLGIGSVMAVSESPDGTLWAVVGVRKAGVVTKIEFIQPTLFRSQQGGAWQNLGFAAVVPDEKSPPLSILPLHADAQGLTIPVYQKGLLNVYRFYGAGFEELSLFRQERPAVGAQSELIYGPIRIAYDKQGALYAAVVDGEPTVPGHQSSQLQENHQSVRVYRMGQSRWEMVTKRALPRFTTNCAFAVREDGAPMVAILDLEYYRAAVWLYEKDQWQILGEPVRGTDDRIDAVQLASRQGKTALAIRTWHQVSLGTLTGSAKGSTAAYNIFELENGAWKALPFMSTYQPAKDPPTMDYDLKGRLWFGENMAEENTVGDVIGSGLRIRRFERGKWSRVGHPMTGARGGFLSIGPTGKATVAVVGKPTVSVYNENFIFRWDGE
jgi:hypothetical protein